MSRPLTRRRHGRHSSYDRLARRTENFVQASQDAKLFVDEQDARLGGTSEGPEGVFDSMHLVQGEDEFFTFEELQAATVPSDIGLSLSFPAQTQSIDFDGAAEGLLNTTDQVLGIADIWSIGIWYKPANLIGTRTLFELGQGFPDASRLIAFFAGTQLNLFWSNSAASNQNDAQWNSFGVLDTWAHLFLSWNQTGTGVPNVFKDGVLTAADANSLTGAIVMADDVRPVGVGTNVGGSRHSGLISQMAVWRTVQDAAISDLYNGGNPNLLDLNSAFGGYSGAADLAHWWRPGHEASPNLGKDFSTAGFTPTIDVEVNAVGITDADRVADVPT